MVAQELEKLEQLGKRLEAVLAPVPGTQRAPVRLSGLVGWYWGAVFCFALAMTITSVALLSWTLAMVDWEEIAEAFQS